jgi:hypothetical protein
MLMVRNLCQVALLFSVQDHKQSLCHFIFYLFISNLSCKSGDISGKAASVFRLRTSKRQANSIDCRCPGTQSNAPLPERGNTVIDRAISHYAPYHR